MDRDEVHVVDKWRHREVGMNTVRAGLRILGLILCCPRRATVSGVTLAAALLLLAWSPASLATLSPTYLACDAPSNGSKPFAFCPANWTITHTPTQNSGGFGVTFPSLIGYLDQTQVAGTTPVYLTCGNVSGPKPPLVCTNNWGVSATTGGHYGAFIGYVYTSQITGTAPVYLACNNVTGSGTKQPPVCDGNWFIATAPGNHFSFFIGYVYITPPVSTYTLSPRYFIGSVIYVPPGQGPSSITYGAGTVTGTTVSTTQSWNNTLTASVTADITGSKGTASVSFGGGFSGSSTTSMDMQSTTTSSTMYKGPASNSINHDYDQILLYMGVKLHASVDYLNNLTWNTDFSQIAAQGFAETGYPISVGCLRANSTIPAALCTATVNFLTSAGVTAADYPAILGADPFADPSAAQSPDASRYLLIDSVNFLPNPTTSTFTYSESNSSTLTNTNVSSYTYTEGLSISLPILKISNSVSITDSSSHSNQTGSISTSAFTLSLPSSPYTGPSTLFVYVDTIYKTFMFSFVQ